MTAAIVGRSSPGALWAGILSILCVVAGFLIASLSPIYILGSTGLCIGAVVAWWNRGVMIGVLALLVLDGVPFINTKPSAVAGTGANVFVDIAFLGLLALLVVSAIRHTRNPIQDRLSTSALGWASLFLTWWAIKTVAGSPGIPLIAAVSYGREFAYFGLL